MKTINPDNPLGGCFWCGEDPCECTPTYTCGEIAEVGLQSWAGLTWHKVEVLGETVRKGQRHLRVRWLEERSFRRIKGKTYFPPMSAIRKVTLCLPLLVGLCTTTDPSQPQQPMPPAVEREIQNQGVYAMRRAMREAQNAVWRAVRGD